MERGFGYARLVKEMLKGVAIVFQTMAINILNDIFVHIANYSYRLLTFFVGIGKSRKLFSQTFSTMK